MGKTSRTRRRKKRARQYSSDARPEGRYFDPTMDSASGVTLTRRTTLAELEADPLLRLERKRRSTLRAVLYAIAMPVLIACAGFLVAVVTRLIGGSYCDAGTATWLCSRAGQIAFAGVPLIVAYIGLGNAAWVTYKKWKTDDAWPAWLALVYYLVPLALLWMVLFGRLLVVRPH